MSRRHLLAASIAGFIWGAIATAVFLAMFRGALPAPVEALLPMAILLIAATLPFQGAIVFETLAGRSSPQLIEVVGLTLVCGVVLGIAVGWTIRAMRMAPASGG